MFGVVRFGLQDVDILGTLAFLVRGQSWFSKACDENMMMCFLMTCFGLTQDEKERAKIRALPEYVMIATRKFLFACDAVFCRYLTFACDIK